MSEYKVSDKNVLYDDNEWQTLKKNRKKGKNIRNSSLLRKDIAGSNNNINNAINNDNNDKNDILEIEKQIKNLQDKIIKSNWYQLNLKLILQDLDAYNNDINNDSKTGNHVTLKYESIVILGIGNFSSLNNNNNAIIQMAVVLNLMNDLNIPLSKQNRLIYDPRMNNTEIKYCCDNNIDVLSLNLQGKHKVRDGGITLYFMPHCPYSLYNNVLWANWGSNMARMAIIGNSFDSYNTQKSITNNNNNNNDNDNDNNNNNNLDCMEYLKDHINEIKLQTQTKGKNNNSNNNNKSIFNNDYTDLILQDAFAETSLMKFSIDSMKVIRIISGNNTNNNITSIQNANKDWLNDHSCNLSLSDVWISLSFEKLLKNYRPSSIVASSSKNQNNELFNDELDYSLIKIQMCDDDGTSFGRDFIKKYFYLDPTLINLNHGSFGAIPKSVMEKQYSNLIEQEYHLDHWFRNSIVEKIANSRIKLCQLVNASCDDLVLVENASIAINCILRSFKWKSNDAIIVFSTAYSMVTETIDWLTEFYGVQKIIIELPFPIKSENEILNIFESKINNIILNSATNKLNIKMAIFSHISSMPSMIEPVKELTSICHKNNILSLVDGAHAPGQIPIDIQDINCDYYTGNCHKWLYAPKGSAFMVVKNNLQSIIHPMPTAISSSKRKDYIGRFVYTGTRDYTPFIGIIDGINFYYSIGPEKNIRYCNELVKNGAKICVDIFNTDYLVDTNMCANMINVILPIIDSNNHENNINKIKFIQKKLDVDHNIYFVYGTVKKLNDENIVFTRLSAQIYNELNDYKQFAELFLKYSTMYGSDSKTSENIA